MSVAVSPDGRTLAVDLQGSIWTLPAAGGAATRITDVFNDARQPTWSPDGKWIAFFAYRDGGYDIWAIAPDGIESAQAHLGRLRRSRAGLVARRHARRLLVRPRQPARQRLQHLDARHPQRRAPPADQGAGRRLHAVVVARRQGDRLRLGARRRAVGVGGQRRRRHRAQGRRRAAGRVDAPSWGPGGQLVYHVTAPGGSSRVRDRRRAADRRRERLRVPRVVGVADRLTSTCPTARSAAARVGAAAAQTIDFTATMQVTRAEARLRASQARLHLDDAAPGARHRAAGDLARRQADRVRRRRRHLRDAGRRQAGQPHEGRGARHRSGVVARRLAAGLLVRQGQRASAALDPRHAKPARAARSPRSTTQPQGATWSPDGKRIVFFNVDGMWRVAQMSVLDVRHRHRHQDSRLARRSRARRPGRPTASGSRSPEVAPLTRRFREGTNQVLTMSATAATPNTDKWFAPVPTLSIDSRGGCGPVWSPDGTKMAAIYEGVLAVWPVARRRRAARPAAPHDHRERALAELGGRLAAHPLSVARQAADRRHRDRRDAHRPARPEIHAGGADDDSWWCTPARWST